MRERFCIVHRMGQMDYNPVWDLQRVLAGEIASGVRPATLLLLEHPHTFTFGRRGLEENLIWDQNERAHRNVRVIWSDRGGDVTYHGPGQLIGYPLLPLAPGGVMAQTDPKNGHLRLPQVDYVGYVRKLEIVLIRALSHFGVAGEQIPGLTGVWVQADTAAFRTPHPTELRRPPAKIAAIGVKVDARGVSQHGFALNVAPDLSYWEGIVGCGLKDFPVTSLAALKRPTPTMASVAQAVTSAFGQVFDYEMVEGGPQPAPGPWQEAAS